MIEFIQENLTLILSGSGVGAVVGAGVVALMNGAKRSGVVSAALASQLQTMVGVVQQFRGGLVGTQDGFTNIISMLTDGGSSHIEEVEPQIDGDGDGVQDVGSTTLASADGVMGAITGAGASALVAAVMAIPALPKMPDLAREFEMLNDNELISSLMGQLRKLDTDGVNTMLDEFKSLVETTIKPAIDKASESGVDFNMEPETIETLTQGAGEFVKVIGSMTGGLDSVLGKLMAMLD